MHALELFGISTAYYVAPITGDARVSRIVTNIGLPWIWERQYRARLHLIDPLPRIAIDRLEAFVWPDQLGDEKLSPKERRYLSIAAKYGLARGVAVACFGPNGRSGFLGAVLSKDAPTPDGIALMRIHSLGQTSIQRYCRLVPRTVTIPALSNRELEVLHWIGQGKSNSVIAELLEISPSSVDVYVRRLFAKLDVSDRTMAAVKALSLGMIISGDYTKMLKDAAQLQPPGGSSLD
ncbi:LuxR family transcriptional regulator [Alteraurantiacibacter aestuarii]|nr:LuxR family transcriptional regulator [Alteraurantiacibacter aestuarii]